MGYALKNKKYKVNFMLIMKIVLKINFFGININILIYVLKCTVLSGLV